VFVFWCSVCVKFKKLIFWFFLSTWNSIKYNPSQLQGRRQLPLTLVPKGPLRRQAGTGLLRYLNRFRMLVMSKVEFQASTSAPPVGAPDTTGTGVRYMPMPAGPVSVTL